VPGIWLPQQIEAWKFVTKAVHQAGGRIFAQLWHVGRISHPSLQPDGGLPVAPSAIRPQGQAWTNHGIQPFVTPRALGIEEIPGVVAAYRRDGLGTNLLLRSLAGFRRAGVRRVWLEVTAQNNRAIRLYRRAGFTTTKVVYKTAEAEYAQ